MLIVGLTGGIGAGKSTVAALFAKENVPIVDADIITRELTIPGTEAFKAIVAHFGPPILTTDGQLNRTQLRGLIFAHAQERHWLENLLHPLVGVRIKQMIREMEAPYCILVIPLLIEVGSYEFIDRILVVDAPQSEQILRTGTRDQMTKAQVEAITASQASRETRLAKADDIILNDGRKDDLVPQVKKLHQFYKELAEHGDIKI